MALPYIKTQDQAVNILQTQWKQQLDPVLANPVTNPNFLTGVKLANGVNTINHLLGRTQQGWVITDVNFPATIYRSKPFNATTLTLTSSAACVVNLLVY